MDSIAGKAAVVTGASSGIGRAAARLFAEAGAKVVVAGPRQAALEALVAEIGRSGGEAVAVVGDAGEEETARSLVDTALGRFGGLDIAFNNAGATGVMRPASDLSLADWRATIDTNLTSAFLGAKYQVPAMLARGGGSIIFTSSFVGTTVGMPGMAAYAAGKAGIVGLVKSLAAELGPRGIRVNALLPGGTDTPSSVPMRPMQGPMSGPLSKVCTRSSAWLRPRRSPGRRFTLHRTPRASLPAPHFSSTAVCRSAVLRSQGAIGASRLSE